FTPPENLSAVVISHFHHDHTADLGAFNYYLEDLFKNGGLKEKVRLVVPDAPCASLNAICEMEYFSIEKVREGDSIKTGDAEFCFFKTKHPVYCLGTRVKEGRKTFVYSSDGDVSSGLEESLSGADFALMHGPLLNASYRRGGAQMSAALCSLLARENGVKTVVSHHSPRVDIRAIEGEIDPEFCSLSTVEKTYEF
ncbi:MAG: hypothetical protein J6126_03870, partial [Clostridia bacterium]|nr:hypothetical protein [Clostridia bacterium]